jgi:outer membrane receptor protein involved in Fe transport
VDLKVSGYNVSKYVNLDYASTRGFEVIISKALRNNYFGGLNYTYSLAKGRSSNSLASIIYPELQTLPREVRMDYDVQHRLSLYAGFTVGPQDEFNVFGLNINDWSASATWSFESGAPYTPYNPNGSTTLSALYLKNSATGPLSSEVDIALSKGFVIFDKMNLAVTLDVKNLFNRRNVDLSAGAGFNDATGAVTRYGDNDPSPANKYPVYPWSSEYGSQSFAARVPPFVFKPPRQLLLGLKVNWN